MFKTVLAVQISLCDSENQDLFLARKLGIILPEVDLPNSFGVEFFPHPDVQGRQWITLL